jgi:CubicO group peptidase (beta-lactamase class C family)
VNFGLGFRVVTDLASTQTLGSNGLYGWSGIYGTVFWVDPKEKLVAIMMVQKYPGPTVAATFQPMVYQALRPLNRWNARCITSGCARVFARSCQSNSHCFVIRAPAQPLKGPCSRTR